MKILVFEYITGGGFAQESLPESLAREGLLMLEALLEELVVLASVQLTVLLDCRVKLQNLSKQINIIQVKQNQSVYQMLPELIAATDLVWPIAPEMDLELKKISELVEKKNKRLLNSSSEAVALCSDKLVTYQLLRNQGVDVVETFQLNEDSPQFPGAWVVKPKDGVGCINSYFVSDGSLFEKLSCKIEQKSDYIFQPYIKGEALSLSCIFREGKAWILCCNRQQILYENNRFKLKACEVNIETERQGIYQNLVDQVAAAISGLWGYVGIDILQPKEDMPLLLEINPRLTTSYVGIQQATGLNVAGLLVKMVSSYPLICKTQNNTTIVSI